MKQIRQFYDHHIRSLCLEKYVKQAEECMKKYDYDACENIFVWQLFTERKRKTEKNIMKTGLTWNLRG